MVRGVVQTLQAFGKLNKLHQTAAPGSSLGKKGRLFVFDAPTNLYFLIDTGADVSVVPAGKGDKKATNDLQLYAANNSVISTFGERLLTLNLGFRRSFPWRFVVADLQYPILGADFLGYYNLLPDLKNKKLIDGSTKLFSNCSYVTVKYETVSTIGGQPAEFTKLLAEFPGLTQPTVRRPCKFIHSTTHVIETTGPPVYARARRLPPDKLKVAKANIEELLQSGDLQLSKSPWASPIHLTPKKGPEKWRLCGDYRRLNAVTRPDKYPVPNILDFNARLDGSTIFTAIDIKRAYYQIPIAEADAEKTAIITPFGLFQYVSMPAGLRNAAQTFQRFVDGLFRGLDFIYAYIDDVLIASPDTDSHQEHVRTALKRLYDAGIVINASKCQYAQEAVSFLGYRVSKDGILPDSTRVQPILDYPQPENVMGLRRFLGMVNFYRRNIPMAAEIQRRLQVLITSNKKNDRTLLRWTPDACKAFEEFKAALSNAALLAHPAADAGIVLCTDASDTAIGGVLHQIHGNKFQPLAFFSRKLSSAEVKYSTYDRELLAIFAAIRHFRGQLEGRNFVIYTDHKPLQYAFESMSEKASPRVVRQLDFIGQFSTDIRYVPGLENVPADAMSRLSALSVPSGMPYEEIAKEQENDTELQEILASGKSSLKLQKMKVPGTATSIYCDVTDNRNRPYLPSKFRFPAFQLVHNLSHPGPKPTTRLLLQRFVWPGINRDGRKWSQACLKCQQAKVNRHTKSPVGEFAAAGRFNHLHLDIVGPLPPSNGYNYIVTMIDRGTRWPEAIPTKNITAENIARIVLTHWIARFGAPIRVTTDQGRQFESLLFQELAVKLGIQKIRTTSYHPQANGMVERWHRTLKAAIRAYATDRWTEILPLVLLGLRLAINSDSGVSPAQLTYGQELRLPGEFFTVGDDDGSCKITNAEDFVQRLSIALRRFSTRSRRHGDIPIFVPASLHSCSHVFLREEVRKGLEPPYSGPYKVLNRDPKTITLDIKGKPLKVSLDRVKPAFILSEQELPVYCDKTPPVWGPNPKMPTRIQPRRHVRFQGHYPK